MKDRKLHKRPSLMLEVLIAFMIVALCVFPLISPHVAIYKEQKKLVSKIELDRAVSNLYATLAERLYRNEVAWSVLASGSVVQIDKGWWKEAGYDRPLLYAGQVTFHIKKHKQQNDGPLSGNLVEAIFSFIPANEVPKGTFDEKMLRKILYSYRIFIAREVGAPSV